MKTLLVLVSFFTATSAFAMGGKPLDSKGTVTVNQPIAISSNYAASNGARPAISLGRGPHALELESSYEEKQPRRSPIPFYNPNRHDDDFPTPVAILLHVTAGEQYAQLRLPLLNENSQSLVPASATGQQFDMLVSVKTVEGKSAPRHETQECQVKDHCYDRGYGEECSYAMGTATAVVHDDLTTRTVSIKFLSGKTVLGTYAGSETDAEAAPEADSVGPCHLNVQH